MPRPYLHDELIAILRSQGNRWMSLDELAREVNARGNYVKGNGTPMGAGQINLRTRSGGSYHHLFKRHGQSVRLQEGSKLSAPNPPVLAKPVIGSSPLDDVVASALTALTGPRHSLSTASANVPDEPGLYAIYGSAEVWAELGLDDPPDDRPLYVGKSESSLVDRDLRTHFGDGRTGSSTLRRTFAALLYEALGLRGIPRNPAKPERFANYGLSPDHDAALTRWMRASLAIAVWPRPADIELLTAERAVLGHWLPPLNLKDVSTPWTRQVKAARAVMAAEARGYAESQLR
jgi:hypothetical protein